MRLGRRAVLFGAVAGAVGAAADWRFGGPLWRPVYYKFVSRRTMGDALAAYGPAADTELKALNDAVGIAYPPEEVALIATKSDRRLEVWARNVDAPFKRIATYE